MPVLGLPASVDWGAVSAILALIGLIGGGIAYLLRRPRIDPRGLMETTGHARVVVVNNGGSEVQVTDVDLVVRRPTVFAVRHPVVTRRRGVVPVAEKEQFTPEHVKPQSETDCYFEFADDRTFELPSSRLTGPALVQRRPARSELRAWAKVPGKRPALGRVEQLDQGEFIAQP